MDNEKNAFYLIDHLVKTILLPDFIEAETNQILKWSKFGISAKCHCPMPDHSDRNASFHIKKMDNDNFIYHCLSGETKVITYDGIFPIKTLAGSIRKILTDRGEWALAPFYNFGKQQVSEITLSRNGQKKKIKATNEHRWFIRSGPKRNKKYERKTNELKVGDRLAWAFPRNKIKQIGGLSPQGITHGIVFGDGSIFNSMACVDLWGEKNMQLLKWFQLNRRIGIKCPSGIVGVKVLDMPFYFKQYPSLEESSSYLAGWLAGLMAADGHVAKDGTICLNSARKNDLEFVRLLATKIGIGTYGITCQRRKGIDGKMSNIYRIHFITEDFDERFFLIDKHRIRFLNSKKEWIRRGWVVSSIKMNVGIEEVYCSVVEKTHSFTLEDNILTGNCFGCGKKGNIVHFCMDYYGLRNKYESILFLCKKFNIKNKEDLIVAGIKNLSKKVDIQRKMESANIITSNQCRILLRKDFKNNKNWVAQAYKELNIALEKEDYEKVEHIGYEASKKMHGEKHE